MIVTDDVWELVEVIGTVGMDIEENGTGTNKIRKLDASVARPLH